MDSLRAHFTGEGTEAQRLCHPCPKYTALSWRPGQDALECTPLKLCLLSFSKIVFVLFGFLKMGEAHRYVPK